MERYLRQIGIKGFGKGAQRRLERSAVLVAGAGGLGTSASVYLAAAGVGKLTLVDSGKVEPSNLNRQILHWESDIGAPKVRSAARKLRCLNPSVEVEGVERGISEENVEGLVKKADVVVDGLDNYRTRFILNEACVRFGVPMVHGAVEGLDGQVTTILPGKGPCLRCIIPKEPGQKGEIPVLGPVPGIIGCAQAMEAIKLITGLGVPLVGRMLILSGREMNFEEIEVRRDPGCAVCGGKR